MKGNGLELRLVSPRDPRFRTLLREMSREGGKNTPPSAEASFAERLEQACVIFCAGKPVGCGGFEQLDEETAVLRCVYVSPTYRKKGYGAQMVDTLELQALFRGCSRVVIELEKGRPGAGSLCKKLGYREGKQPGGERKTLWMEKNLDL